MKKKGLSKTKGSGFEVPKDYFEEFEARMMAKIDSSSKHHVPSESSPFKVPEGYFEEFDDRLLQQLEQEPRENKVIPLNAPRRWYYVSAVAAVLIVLITSTFVKVSDNVNVEELDLLAVENYLLETLEYDNPEETLMMEENDFSWASNGNYQVNQEALYEYLTENIEEPSILLNEN